MIKSYIPVIGAVIGIPAIIGACFFEGTNFYVSLAFLAVKFLVSEGYMASTITMMQRTVKP
jgi:predicted PurR-regulated permease PerM